MFIICTLNHFSDICLKILADNSHVSVILMLTSIDCLFYIQIKIFLILDVENYFFMGSGNFGYYVMLPWILLTPSVLAGLYFFDAALVEEADCCLAGLVTPELGRGSSLQEQY